MRKASIPDGDPIRTLLPNLRPLGQDQVGEDIYNVLFFFQAAVDV